MKKISLVLCAALCALLLGACAESSDGYTVFQATVIEISDGSLLIEPAQGSAEAGCADRMTVPMKDMEPSPEPEAGDIVEITYSGEIAETYPAQIRDVRAVRVIEKARTGSQPDEPEKWDLTPMVMVNGTLYLDTGCESAVEGRCGVMDGEISSSVDGGEMPTEDDQSNFGVGYGYQYGAAEGTIEIYMNEKWWIFATEEARQQIQFPAD